MVIAALAAGCLAVVSVAQPAATPSPMAEQTYDCMVDLPMCDTDWTIGKKQYCATMKQPCGGISAPCPVTARPETCSHWCDVVQPDHTDVGWGDNVCKCYDHVASILKECEASNVASSQVPAVDAESSVASPSPPQTALRQMEVGGHFDCGSEDRSNCQAAWSETKKSWCASMHWPCEASSFRGYEGSTQMLPHPLGVCRVNEKNYDCKDGWFNCVSGWSRDKKDFCDKCGKPCGEDSLKDYHFSRHTCSLGGGMSNVIASRTLSLYAAEVACARDEMCAGFYHRGSASENGFHEMIFKSSWDCETRSSESAAYSAYRREQGRGYPAWHICSWLYKHACPHHLHWLYEPPSQSQDPIAYTVWWLLVAVVVLAVMTTCIICAYCMNSAEREEEREDRPFFDCCSCLWCGCCPSWPAPSFKKLEADVCQLCGGTGRDNMGQTCVCQYVGGGKDRRCGRICGGTSAGRYDDSGPYSYR